MDPFEQRLRDEVIYLHSLWHQGPPRNPNHNPYPKPKHNPSRNLHPSNSTPFKKNTTTTTTKNKNKKKNKPQSDPPKISGVEWPCEKPAAETAPPNSGWPALKLNSATSRPASAEEQAKLVATRVQQKGLEACSAFFARNRGSDIDDDQEEDDDDFVDMNDCEESEEYDFFLKAFTEDNELRSYYEKNFESGVFCCLVCGGIGKKVNKRFKNCVALVQHSTAISKTAKRRAHKAYGQVICKVLGWDMNRLPSIVLSLGDSLNRSLPKSGQSQGDQQENADGDNDDLSVLQEEKDLADKSVGLSNVGIGELVVCESASKEANANVYVEDFDQGVSALGANIEGSVNCLEHGVGSVGNGIKNIQEQIVALDGPREDSANQNKESLKKEVSEELQVNIEKTKH